MFAIEGGARHLWQLSAITTAIATCLGALSRSHGTRAHHKGGANSGEVQKTAQGERKSCPCTWKTPAPLATSSLQSRTEIKNSIKDRNSQEWTLARTKHQSTLRLFSLSSFLPQRAERAQSEKSAQAGRRPQNGIDFRVFTKTDSLVEAIILDTSLRHADGRRM